MLSTECQVCQLENTKDQVEDAAHVLVFGFVCVCVCPSGQVVYMWVL